jgi:hypothetical protein
MTSKNDYFCTEKAVIAPNQTEIKSPTFGGMITALSLTRGTVTAAMVTSCE